ncbi:MAG: stalk domain-containing protein [Armatimonadota bacterium]
MRKFRIVSAIVICAVLVLGLAAAAKDVSLKFYINGVQKTLKPSAIMRNNTAYLPLNATAAAVNAKVKFDNSDKTYTVTTSSNMKTTIRESQGIKVGGKFMVPANTAANALNYSWGFNASSKTVSLNSKPVHKPAPKPAQKPAPPTSGG